MIKAAATILFCLYGYSFVHAQNSYSIQGRIVDAENKPIESATILLNQYPDSILLKTYTDKLGRFQFSGLAKSGYTITVVATGYQKLTSKAVYVSDLNTDAGVITLRKAVQTLKDVVVTSKRPFIEAHPGKVVLNVSESSISAGNNALDILKRAPGVQTDENDILKLNGRQGVLVTINGKPTYLTGADLADLLRTTQSSTIDQIELISSPGANQDAAGGAGIINIKLLRDKNLGVTGALNISSGFSSLGNDYHHNLRYVPALSLNARGKKVSAFANYSYTDIGLGKTIGLNRNVYSANTVSNINVDYWGNTQRRSHSYRTGVDYSISPMHTIGAMFNGSASAIDIVKANVTDIFSGGTAESQIKTDSEQSRNVSNASYNLNYRGLLGKKKNELSVDADYSVFRRKSEETLNLLDTYLRPRPMPMKASTNPKLLQNLSPAKYNIRSIKADYLMQVSASTKLSFGGKSSRVFSNNAVDFGEIKGNVFVPDARFTNKFNFKEFINSLYAIYNKTYKQSTVQLGLRAEYTSSKGISGTDVFAKKYMNLFPNVAFTRNLNSKNQLLLSYSRRIDRPAYEDLNPFLAYLDQYNYRSGNPNLGPQYSDNLEATHVFLKKYTTTLRFSQTHHAYSTVFHQDDNTRVITSIRENLDNMYAYGLVLNAPVKATRWWSANVNVSALNIRYKSNSGGGSLNDGRPDITVKALQNFSLPGGIGAEFGSKYQSPSFYGILNYKHIFNMDLGFSKSFLNKQATMRISATDILNGDKNRFDSDYQNLNLTGFDKNETRAVLLNLSWQFGKTSVSAVKRRNPGSEAEQSRVGNLNAQP